MYENRFSDEIIHKVDEKGYIWLIPDDGGGSPHFNIIDITNREN